MKKFAKLATGAVLAVAALFVASSPADAGSGWSQPTNPVVQYGSGWS